MAIIPAPIASRDEFGDLLVSMGLLGDAAEVGAYRGAFSAMLLSKWPGKVTCIDPWAYIPDYSEWISGTDEQRAVDMEHCRRALEPYGDRYSLMALRSDEAVHRFVDGSLDFVYIDANHEPEHIRYDLAAWWPKVRQGGVFAGHDWHGDWQWSVRPAVEEFASLMGRDIYVVPGREEPSPALGGAASWYLIR